MDKNKENKIVLNQLGEEIIIIKEENKIIIKQVNNAIFELYCNSDGGIGVQISDEVEGWEKSISIDVSKETIQDIINFLQSKL